MYKLIRCFAPVVLVLFFCGLFAGMARGEEGKDQNLIFLSASQPTDYSAGGGFGYEWNMEQHKIGVEWTNTGQKANGDYLYVYGLYWKVPNNDDSYYSFGLGGATYNNKSYKRIEASGAVTGFIQGEEYRGSVYVSAFAGRNIKIFDQLFSGEIGGLVLNQESLLMVRIKYLFPDFIFAR